MDRFILGGIFLVLFIIGISVWVYFEGRKIKWYNGLIAIVSGIILELALNQIFVGNAWYRNTGPNGEMQVNFTGMMKILFEPLRPNAIWLWSPDFWYQNVFVIIAAILISLTYIRR
jgi:hypothetical protein